MLVEKMQNALNRHLNVEYYSAYLYLSMSAYFESIDLPGFAHWMRIQFQEEWDHGMKIFDYISRRDGRVELEAIEVPKKQWESAQDTFEEILKHEQNITELVSELVDLSLKEKDHATNQFLQWFVEEQVEEEANVKAILQKIRMIGDSSVNLLLLDQELAQRTLGPTNQNG